MGVNNIYLFYDIGIMTIYNNEDDSGRDISKDYIEILLFNRLC